MRDRETTNNPTAGKPGFDSEGGGTSIIQSGSSPCARPQPGQNAGLSIQSVRRDSVWRRLKGHKIQSCIRHAPMRPWSRTPPFEAAQHGGDESHFCDPDNRKTSFPSITTVHSGPAHTVNQRTGYDVTMGLMGPEAPPPPLPKSWS